MTNPNTALVVSKPKDLLDYLTKSRSAIEMALPKHLNPDRMMRLALTCFSTNSDLRNCTAQSILSSVVVASQIGLEPGVAGQGYLIPYGRTCTFIPGWQGLVGLLNNTGRATAWTGAVFEGDEFDFQLGSHPKCRHIPGPNFGDDTKLVWVYACGKVNGSEQPVVEAWPMTRVLIHRDRYNKVGAKHYSHKNLEMYARKVVLLQVLKYMPRSIELNNAIVAADAAEIGRSVVAEDGAIIEVEQVEEPKRPEMPPGVTAPPAAPPTPPPAAKRQEPPPAATKPAPKAPAPPPPPAPAAPEPEAEPEPAPEPEAPEQSDYEQAEAALGLAPEPEPAPAPAPAPANEPANVVKLRELMKGSGVTEEQVMKFCQSNKIAKPEQKTLGSLVVNGQDGKIVNLIRAWGNISPKIKAVS